MPATQYESFLGATRSTTHGRAATTATLAYRSAQSSSNLPPQLQNVVPSCAQSCLQTYISQDYTSCPQAGFPCLCSKYSSQGYTLGELAFVCLQAQCPSASEAKQTSLYDVCSDATNAVSPTHSTLTLPPATATLTVTSTTATPEAATTGSVSSSTSMVYTSSAASTYSTSTSVTPSVTAAATNSSSNSSGLTTAQSVGISVAAFGGTAILFALIFFIVCMRRRKAKRVDKKQKKHGSYDFIDEDPPRIPPLSYSNTDSSNPTRGFANSCTEAPSEKTEASKWERAPLPRHHTPCRLGSQGAEMKDAQIYGYGSREQDMRMQSQPLPESPAPVQHRIPPKRPDRSPTRPVSMRTPATVFEEDRSPRVVSTQLPPLPAHTLPAHPRPAHPLPVYAGLPGRNIKNPQYAPHITLSPDEVRMPALSLEIPQSATKTAKISSPTMLPPPPVPADSPRTSSHRASRSSKAKSGASTTGGSLLNYYTSQESGTVPDFWEPEPTPISTDPQRSFKPALRAIKVPKPIYPPRAVRHSGGSDTSFESTDPDEPTPPDEEDRRLSAVAEHSPIAAVRYPKVPRSSNQSIPRSPPIKLSPGLLYKHISVVPGDDRARLPSHGRQRSGLSNKPPVTPDRQKLQHTSSLSGSTLATKQRGDSTPKKSDGRLVIDTSHSPSNSYSRSLPRNSSNDNSADACLPPSLRPGYRHDSPLKGYGRVTSNNSGLQKPNVPTVANGLLTPELQTTVLVTSPTAQHFWPKLTPSRRGDDMFLQVGLVSPDPISGVEETRRAF